MDHNLLDHLFTSLTLLPGEGYDVVNHPHHQLVAHVIEHLLVLLVGVVGA